MKKILLTLTFCTIFVAWGLLNASELTDEHPVIRGERPPISLNSLTAADYEAGKIYVKFKAEYSNLVQSGFSLDKNQYIKTGLQELDVLNQQYLASEYKQIIQTVYSSNQKSTQFKQRHQAWGFHLWFEVKLDEAANIVAAVEAFQSNPAIELAEPIYKTVLYDLPEASGDEGNYPKIKDNNSGSDRFTADDTYLSAQWHYNNTGTYGGTAGKDISLFDAWDIEKGHSDVIVAIIDGGIQTDHEDLAGNMWSGVGYNFVDGNSTIVPHSHGTHVAGTVAAETNNTIGVAGVAGGSGSDDGVRLMSCQVFTDDSGGGFAEAMIYAADNDAAISQNSWGTSPPGNYSYLVLDAIDYFNANGGGDVLDGGITIFAAANDNDDDHYYPGYYSGTLSVAATNNRDERSYYSNYGDYIDISAPGGEQTEFGQAGVASTDITDSYTYKQGTSMACPHVSGVAALIVSYAHRNGVTLKNADVYQILKETTDDHYAENPGYIGKLGTGRLNAHAALLATNNYFSPTALTPDHSFDFDGTMQGWYSVATTGHKNFVWTDQGALYGGQIESATADNGYVMLNNLYEEWMGPSPNAAALYSPIFDLTGFTNLIFSFDHKARQIGQDNDPPFPNMSIKLEASNDGFVSNIQELWSYNFPNTAHLSIEGVQSVNISALAGSPNVQFRFNYAGGGGYWWLIDDVTINDFTPQITSLPYSETFDSNLGDCYTYSVSGDTKNWIWQDYNGNGFAKMSGYNSGETEEDWLILPEINADDYTTITMNFETAYNYGTDDANNYLKLFYSTDYSGIGNPDNTNWTELNFTQPDAGNYVYVNSGDIDLSAISGQFYLGFKYRDVGIEGNYRTWQIDNINILEVLPYYYISFEGNGETKATYASGTVTISNVEWNLTDALIGESASDYKTGMRSVRMRGYGTSVMTMLQDKANGIGSIYFNYRRYGTDQQVDWKVEYSTNAGSDWTQIGSTFTSPASDEVQTFHEKVNIDGNVRIRIKRATETGSSNRRLNIDDIIITDYNKVTFLADMSLAAGFDAETDVVYLSGNLITPPWGEPGTNSNALFSRLGPTNTWINVLNLSELQYEYKLFKNTGWGNGEWDGNPNRKRTVSHGEIVTELYSYVEFSGNGAISDPSNWAASTIPDGNNIMISGTAQLNQALVAESVIIEEGGSITIPPLQDLTVNNTLTNNAGAAALLLQSDASGTGSLIHSSADVPATIQRYINGGGYHLVSVPINGALTAGLFMHSYLYYFDATADPQDWDGVGEDPEIAITNNQGYMIWFTSNNTTYDFEGALMSGDFVTATPAAASVYNGSYNEGGYNLVPNPYPSAIDWNAEGGFTENNLFETIWIYNRDAGNYGAYVRDAGSGTNEVSNIIPVGQSFFVQASNAGSGSLTIKNEARTHSANNFLKEPAQIAEMLRLHAAANNLSDELLVQFNADASPTFEGNRDAQKMRSDGEAPQLFSLSEEGTELSINTLPYRDETIVIPIGFELSTVSEVSFNFTNLESFSPLAEIYLEDLLSGQMINLREQQEYSFTHATENDPLRFRLHFKGVVGLDEQAVSGHLIWSYDDKVYVSIPALTGEKAIIQLVDMQGKILYQGAHNLSNPEIITVRTNQHVLVARIIAGNQVFTNKVFIR
ncbi:MAG: S8 family serine peptidase [Sphaerochaetaceae bacterium]|nr:S8 family serine peptidase [Sphaerochaetaceae bacterium]